MEQIALLYPYALLALALLPVIYFISKISPPAPARKMLPSFDFLIGLSDNKKIVNDAPWWLKIIRIFAIGLIISSLAAPYFIKPQTNLDSTNQYLIIVEDGFSNANNLRNQKQIIINYIKNAEETTKGGKTYALLQTSKGKDNTLSWHDGNHIINDIEKINAQPVFTDYEPLIQFLGLSQKIISVCACDYSDHNGKARFMQALSNISDGKAILAGNYDNTIIIQSITEDENGYIINLDGINKLGRNKVDFYDEGGKIITSTTISGSSGQINIPGFKRRQIFYAKIDGQNNAGATYILNIFGRRPMVGIERTSFDNPLLSDNTYIEAASKIHAEILKSDINDLITKRPAAIIFGDKNGFTDDEYKRLDDYVKQGGMIIRFAGPRTLTKPDDALLPAPLNSEPKILSGNFAWTDKSIDTIGQDSPLYGLQFGDDMDIRKLASFAKEDNSINIWARLKDKSPFISSRKLENGYIVLVHTSAGPEWAQIGLSKYLYEIIDRILLRAQNLGLPPDILPPSQALSPLITINGYGEINQNPSGTNAILPEQWKTINANANQPPGIYSGGGSTLILNMTKNNFELKEFKFGNNVKTIDLADAKQANIAPILLIIGLILLLFDMLLVIFKKSEKQNIMALFAIIALLPSILPLNTKAQEFHFPPQFQFSPNNNPLRGAPHKKTRPDDLMMAYIKTGDAKTDTQAKAGMEGLKNALSIRTNVEPKGTISVDPSKDELALYPVLYWLLPDKPTILSDAAKANLNRFMANGGLLVIDTRGGGRDAKNAQNITRLATNGLYIPPLERVPDGHVMNKTFYLLRGYPARFGNANMWVEAQNVTDFTANDGVSPIIITDGDWAYVWSQYNNTSPVSAFSPDEMRREISIRVGINIYLYALTGQYKNDQVHIPLLLERLSSEQKGAPEQKREGK